jgi:mannosyltransferase OCH1-like enzyme
MKMDDGHTTRDSDVTVKSDATVPLPDDTSVDKDLILMKWIYENWKSLFSSMEDSLDKFSKDNSKRDEVNPILKSEKADRLMQSRTMQDTEISNQSHAQVFI